MTMKNDASMVVDRSSESTLHRFTPMGVTRQTLDSFPDAFQVNVPNYIHGDAQSLVTAFNSLRQCVVHGRAQV